MSTICFDIKRVDENYVCIQHCNTNKFEYEYHIPFSFYPRQRKGKDHWWLADKYYRYVWLLVGKDETGIEQIFWACNDKLWTNHAIREYNFRQFTDIRVVKLPFERVEHIAKIGGEEIPIYITTDLGSAFKLWCPVELNEKHHVYADHYEEIEPTVTEVDGFEFKERNFQWVPPKMLGE